MGLHFILQHLDRPGTYVRILFVDISSAFNTIIPSLLQPKLTQLSVPNSICQWINSFLTDWQQLVRLGTFSSSTRTISTGAPQGCVLSPVLFSLYTNDCTSKDPSVKLLKFADDTTVISLIQDGDESAEAVLPSPAEEVQPATGASETVLLCHHWIHPLHVNNCLVQLSYQIWPQKTTEGSLDCWANHWYTPPHSPKTVLIQSEQKGC